MQVREEFAALTERIHGRRLVYLDSASTAQKPRAVLEAMHEVYTRACANVHRGVHTLSERATAAYEGARRDVQRFLNAEHPQEVVFTRGTTESLNLVAQSFGAAYVGAGDEVLVTAMEHHSNIVPWRQLCDARGARLRVVPVDAAGTLATVGELLTRRTRIVALTHVSNALGTVNPVAQVSAQAHAVGAVVVVDGAQAAPHLPVDVRVLGCDFYAFSGHKLYGPTGIGVLYGRQPLFERMPPWQGGGDMIEDVSFEVITYAQPPYKHEAGTPNIAGAIGLGAAIRWVESLGREHIVAHERRLLERLVTRLESLPRIQLVGRPSERCAVISFNVDGVHPHDVGTLLDRQGVAVRAGHHCTQPLMEGLGLSGTVRASLAVYNDDDDIEQLALALGRVVETFA
jgi:cysteine desulfurase/selenocysteine lyase